jgi:hypothetical protein
MKSPQVTNVDPINKDGYTDLMVCMSAAGYYVGTMYNNFTETGELMFQEPGSRDTGYYETREQAEYVLRMIECGEEQTTRLTP